MSPEEQRIAIAKTCPKVFFRQAGSAGWNYLNPRLGRLLPCIDGDPLNDLNAMHEAERCLMNSTDGAAYGKYLCGLTMGFEEETVTLNNWALARVARATAAQRAEAFLRATGKWKETP